MAVQITINGDDQLLDLTPGQSTVHDLVSLLKLKADQVAIEQNGSIVRRTQWIDHTVESGDRFEIVQFVGGGCARGGHADPEMFDYAPPVSSRRSRSQRLP